MVKVLFFLIIFIFIGNNSHSEAEYYLTLKSGTVNLRQGPSLDHPIKLIYKKKFLPVKILDKSETWRKIRDFENNSGWIHISQLSKKKSAINVKNNSILYKKPTIFSKPLARIESGRLMLVKKCEIKWCKISTDSFNGWILKNALWGKTR